MLKKANLFVVVLATLILTSSTHALIWDSGHHEFSSGYEGELALLNDASADITGGHIGILWGEDSSAVNTYDGCIIDLLRPNVNCTANVYGGNITSVFTLVSSVTNIYNGSLRDITADNSSIINLYVENDYDYDPNGGIYGHGLLTGTWFNTSDNFSISLSTYAYDHINFVPEPCSLFTVLLGGIFLSIRKK